jgi:hypothetical protein
VILRVQRLAERDRRAPRSSSSTRDREHQCPESRGPEEQRGLSGPACAPTTAVIGNSITSSETCSRFARRTSDGGSEDEPGRSDAAGQGVPSARRERVTEEERRRAHDPVTSSRGGQYPSCGCCAQSHVGFHRHQLESLRQHDSRSTAPQARPGSRRGSTGAPHGATWSTGQRGSVRFGRCSSIPSSHLIQWVVDGVTPADTPVAFVRLPAGLAAWFIVKRLAAARLTEFFRVREEKFARRPGRMTPTSPTDRADCVTFSSLKLGSSAFGASRAHRDDGGRGRGRRWLTREASSTSWAPRT